MILQKSFFFMIVLCIVQFEDLEQHNLNLAILKDLFIQMFIVFLNAMWSK